MATITGQLDTASLVRAAKRVKVALYEETDEQRLQVLAHIIAILLTGKSPAEVTAYLVKITKMLDGQFDR